MQFTIAQLVRLIVVLAIVFAILRIPGAAIAVALCAVLSVFVLPGFIINRRGGGSGLKGGVISGAVSFVGLGAALLLYVVLTPSGSAPLLVFDPIWYFGSLAVAGAICGIVISIPLYLIVEHIIGTDHTYRGPPTDDTCGPIHWHEFR